MPNGIYLRQNPDGSQNLMVYYYKQGKAVLVGIYGYKLDDGKPAYEPIESVLRYAHLVRDCAIYLDPDLSQSQKRALYKDGKAPKHTDIETYRSNIGNLAATRRYHGLPDPFVAGETELRVYFAGKTIRLGSFDTAEEAALAHDIIEFFDPLRPFNYPNFGSVPRRFANSSPLLRSQLESIFNSSDAGDLGLSKEQLIAAAARALVLQARDVLKNLTDPLRFLIENDSTFTFLPVTVEQLQAGHAIASAPPRLSPVSDLTAEDVEWLENFLPDYDDLQHGSGAASSSSSGSTRRRSHAASSSTSSAGSADKKPKRRRRSS